MINIICTLKVNVFGGHHKERETKYLVVVSGIKTLSIYLFMMSIKAVHFLCTNNIIPTKGFHF